MEVDKILKPKKNVLIVGLVFLAIAIGLFIGATILDNTKYDGEEIHIYNDLISKKQDEENQLVKLEITELPYLFATKTENNTKQNFYFAVDEYNYWYIIRITDKTYNEMEKQHEQDSENFKYVLKGYIYNDPSELKNLAISAYNEAISEEAEKLTYSNFRSYLGNTYLDETITPNSDISPILIAVGIISVMVAVALIATYISRFFKLKLILKKYDIEELKDELSNIDIEQYKKQSVYLTNKYIISTINGVDVLEYSDVLWVYNEKRKQNGMLIGIWLNARTINKRRYRIATTKKEDILIEIMEKIKEKNDDVLVGFTSENNKRYKELVKQNNNGVI